MNSFIRKYSINTLIISILLVVLSFFLIFRPAESLSFIIVFLGCISILDGIIHIISYFTTSPEYKTLSFELVQGVLAVLLGIIFVFYPHIVIAFLPFVLGAWIIVEGIIRFQFALNIKGSQIANWIIVLVLSILSILFGFLIILHPFGTAITLTSFIGIFLLISEILNIIESIYVIIKFKE